MFDVLVESTKGKQDGRAGRYFVLTTMIYSMALIALGVGTIIGFSPALAEEYNLTAVLTAPVPFAPEPPPISTPSISRADTPPNVFAPPTNPPKDILLPDAASKIPVRVSHLDVNTGLPPCNGCSSGKVGVPGGIVGEGDPPPAPPEPKPAPKLDPTPTPAVKTGPNKVSEGVLQGGAINKIMPPYPQIARTVRASGPVQVVVTISEEGRVIEAYAASGHPLLRATAVEAARSWTFKPTLLSNVPVKVQGMLTFNFTLQ
jgi:protein TonB